MTKGQVACTARTGTLEKGKILVPGRSEQHAAIESLRTVYFGACAFNIFRQVTETKENETTDEGIEYMCVPRDECRDVEGNTAHSHQTLETLKWSLTVSWVGNL